MGVGVLVEVRRVDALAQLGVAATGAAHKRLVETREIPALGRVDENARQRQVGEGQDFLEGGLAARGIVQAVVGLFLVQAALLFDAGKVQSSGSSGSKCASSFCPMRRPVSSLQ